MVKFWMYINALAAVLNLTAFSATGAVECLGMAIVNGGIAALLFVDISKEKEDDKR